MSVVISVRIRRELKETLEKHGINISEEIRRHLEELAKKLRIREELEELNKIIRDHVKPSPRGFAVRSVREDRHDRH